MSYGPYTRSPSGIVFFGSGVTEPVFLSVPGFTYANNSLQVPNILLPNNGQIGVPGQADAIVIDSAGNVTFTDNLTIQGNITVNGTTTTVNSETLTINDNIIILNNNEAGVPTQDAGIQVERGSSANTELRWNETSDFWEMTNDGSIYLELASRTGTQTLLNKTIAAGSNTITGLTNTNLSGSAGITNANLANSTITLGTTSTALGATSVNLAGLNSVSANWFVGSLSGNSRGFTSGVTINLGDDLSGSVTFTDAGQTVTLNAAATASLITGLTANTSANGTDQLIIESGGFLRRITRANFISGLGGGTVTSVAIAGTSGLVVVDGSPITSNGTINLSLGAAAIANSRLTNSTVTFSATTGGSQVANLGDTFTLSSASGVQTTVVGTRNIQVALVPTAVSANSYGSATQVGTFTVDANGRLTAAGNTTISIPNSSVTKNVYNVSADATASGEVMLVTTGGTNRTITLLENQPAGTFRTIKKVDSGVGSVIIARTGADTIDGATSKTLFYQYEAIDCVSNGADWFII